jgi:hypothetical protein
VTTINTTVVLVSKNPYVSPTCLCTAGVGAQLGSDKAIKQAVVSFDSANRMCSSSYNPARAVNATPADKANGKKFTLSFSAKGGNATCLYKYSVDSGVVMGYTNRGHVDDMDAGSSTGATVVALLMSVMFLAIFIGSACSKTDGTSTYDH